MGTISEITTQNRQLIALVKDQQSLSEQIVIDNSTTALTVQQNAENLEKIMTSNEIDSRTNDSDDDDWIKPKTKSKSSSDNQDNDEDGDDAKEWHHRQQYEHFRQQH